MSAAKEGAGAVDEEDFIKAFEDVPTVQVSRICVKTRSTKKQKMDIESSPNHWQTVLHYDVDKSSLGGRQVRSRQVLNGGICQQFVWKSQKWREWGWEGCDRGITGMDMELELDMHAAQCSLVEQKLKSAEASLHFICTI